jgi:hypothetical protein
MLVLNIPVAGIPLGLAVLAAGLLALAARGSFIAGGYDPQQHAATKPALAISIALGWALLLFLAAAFLADLWEKGQPAVSQQWYTVSADGVVYLVSSGKKFYRVEESGTSAKAELSPPRFFRHVMASVTIPGKQNQTSCSWRTALVNRRLPTATFWERTPDTLWLLTLLSVEERVPQVPTPDRHPDVEIFEPVHRSSVPA